MVPHSMNLPELLHCASSKTSCALPVSPYLKTDRRRGPLDRLQGSWCVPSFSSSVVGFLPAEQLRFLRCRPLYQSIQNNFLIQRWQSVSPEVLTFLLNRDTA